MTVTDHAQLSNITAGAHHSRYTDNEARSAVPAANLPELQYLRMPTNGTNELLNKSNQWSTGSGSYHREGTWYVNVDGVAALRLLYSQSASNNNHEVYARYGNGNSVPWVKIGGYNGGSKDVRVDVTNASGDIPLHLEHRVSDSNVTSYVSDPRAYRPYRQSDIA